MVLAVAAAGGPRRPSHMRVKNLLFLFVVVIAASACAPHVRRVPPNPANPVYTLAVLPMYNLTNDVGGAEVVRAELAKRLDRLHYQVMPVADSDRVLSDRMGITLGDQLEYTTPGEVGRTLGVDGVVYGWLINFDDITTGVYNEKKVRAAFKLYSTRTGDVLWERALGVKSIIAGGDVGAGVAIFRELKDPQTDLISAVEGLDEVPGVKNWQIIRAYGSEKIEEAAILAIGEKMITKAFNVHLRLEADTMLNMLVTSFPAGPGHPVRLSPPEEEAPGPRPETTPAGDEDEAAGEDAGDGEEEPGEARED